LSSSTPDLTNVKAPSPLVGDGLAELLSVLAEAPDFATAGTFLLEQFTDVAGAKRAFVLTLTAAHDALETVAQLGFEGDEGPALRIPLDDITHPAVVAALALSPAQGDRHTAAQYRIPLTDWTAIPFPGPYFRGAPPMIPTQRARELAAGVTLFPDLVEHRHQLGHAPCGVILLGATPRPEELGLLARAALLAGPLLARMVDLERFRQAAERLDQQRDLLTAIVNSLPDPIVITDASNDIVVQNRRAEHLLAARDSDSEGRRRAVEINNLLFTSFLSKSVISGGLQGGSRELNLVDPDEGTDLLFEVLSHPLTVTVSRDGSFVSVLRDVTDLRRAANELERQFQRVRLAEIEASRERDRLNLILENVADPILVTDDRSNIILMNPQAEVLFEIDGADRGNRRRAQAVQGNDTKFTTFISDFTLGPARARREQMRLTNPATGADLPIEVVSGKITNERGEPMVIVSVLHDLTKQVENERLYEELKNLNAELEARVLAATADLANQNAQLQWQSRELERANRLKSEFLASMSHELRTPINALIGYTALMLDRIYGELTGKQEEGLKRIQASAQHLLALINDILDLAKIEAGKMPLHLEDVPINQIVAEITQQIEPLVRKKSLEFLCMLPPDAPSMRTDRVKVKQILLNLLSNAVKFTHHGHVALTVSREGEMVRLDVADTGIGIQGRDLEAIWEDFRQLDQSRTREYGGTGLGLSITRKLVAQLGGSISVTSTFGGGSTFSVLLPLQSEQLPDELTPASVPRITPAGGSPLIR
jgi:PAS domain S-box-containing protein